ncbi:hypothetical protein EYF80_028556 [Liparis tanakae]|uniref:Uncharacterized protein n=1 Tax=Liparis tanakae TaxID=230148 RepID=A0A4Z2H6L8_9TELE|nr:hypothetical protein EYF80_028556 [Liparis tanakae]
MSLQFQSLDFPRPPAHLPQQPSSALQPYPSRPKLLKLQLPSAGSSRRSASRCPPSAPGLRGGVVAHFRSLPADTELYEPDQGHYEYRQSKHTSLLKGTPGKTCSCTGACAYAKP